MKALVVATGIVFWTLVLGIAWLALFPGSDAGEPVAILQVEPVGGVDAGAAADAGATPDANTGASVEEGHEPATAEAPAADADTGETPADMPPGFAVTAPGAKPPDACAPAA